MSNFTPEQVQEILDLYFENFAHRQYIGARYVPIFGRKGETSIEWDNSAPYEPLTIVLHEGNSYTSRQFVPAGVAITNELYWAETGNFNAQIEQYRQEVQALSEQVTEYSQKVNDVFHTYDVVNAVEDIGCDNTGTSFNDDLVSAYDTDNKIVFFPAGKYKFQHPLNCSAMAGVTGNDYEIVFRTTEVSEDDLNHEPAILVEESPSFFISKAKIDSDSHGIKIVSSDNVHIDGVHLSCAHYTIYMMGDDLGAKPTRNVYINNCVFENGMTPTEGGYFNHSDGIHINNYCENIYIDGIVGHTGDDMIALNASENHDTEGWIRNVYINDVCTVYKGINSACGFRAYGTEGNKIENVFVTNCVFDCLKHPINLRNKVTAAPTTDNTLQSQLENFVFENIVINIRNAYGATADEDSKAVYIIGVKCDSQITFKNITVNKSNFVDSDQNSFIVASYSSINKLVAENVYIGQNFTSALITTTSITNNVVIDEVVFRDVKLAEREASTQIAFISLYGYLTINNLLFDNVYYDVYKLMLIGSANVKVKNLAIVNSHIDINDYIIQVQSTAGGDRIDTIRLANNYLSFANAVFGNSVANPAVSLAMDGNYFDAIHVCVRFASTPTLDNVRLKGFDCISDYILTNGKQGDMYRSYSSSNLNKINLCVATNTWQSITAS